MWHKKFIAAAFAFVLVSCAGTTPDVTTRIVDRVGIYDSRAVAVAYAGSSFHEAWLADLKSQHETAQAAGNKEKAKELEERAKDRQGLLHMQGFSTYPVDEYLGLIEEQVSGIKKRAGVEAIVSKWNKKELKKYGDAKRVDITTHLIDAFDPKPASRRSAIEVQKHEPISRLRARLLPAK
jgi:hypothetical protein